MSRFHVLHHGLQLPWQVKTKRGELVAQCASQREAIALPPKLLPAGRAAASWW